MSARRGVLVAVAALAACAHGDPFDGSTGGAVGPFASIGFPTRLTYNRGHDQDASWLPDGSGIVYTAERYGVGEGDWCLMVLPPTGGSAVRSQCVHRAEAADSVNALRAGAVGPDGRVAFVRESSPRHQLSPRFRELVVGAFGTPGAAEAAGVISAVPYTLPGVPTHNDVGQVRWLDAYRLVYRGDVAGYTRACSGCVWDTVASGRNLVLVQLGAGGPVRVVLPGTEYATSVAVRGPDEILFTRGGDARVYSLRLSTGDTATVWAFGGVARGVQIAGDRLVAVVGGPVTFDYDVGLRDSMQTDGGGFLLIVDLAAGVEGVVDQFSLYRNPALSPDGRRLVVETVARAPDLYLFDLP